MSTDRETLNVYDAKADEYATLVTSSENTHLAAFMGHVTPGGVVLEDRKSVV